MITCSLPRTYIQSYISYLSLFKNNLHRKSIARFRARNKLSTWTKLEAFWIWSLEDWVQVFFSSCNFQWFLVATNINFFCIVANRSRQYFGFWIIFYYLNWCRTLTGVLNDYFFAQPKNEDVSEEILRRREKNRKAAMKCREKKRKTIDNLQEVLLLHIVMRSISDMTS